LDAITGHPQLMASKVGGIPEFVSDENGVLVNGQDFEQWEQSLIKFVNIKFDREVVERSIQQICDVGVKRERLLNIYNKHSSD
ncbi:MAG: hypothetical protein RJQ14_22080, partial [Marinoscillum sp.]